MCAKIYQGIKDMDWGILTADIANAKTNTVVHIFNHYISNDVSIDRTVRFVKGRILWFDNYLLQKLNHEVIIDDVGQPIGVNEKKRITSALCKYATKIIFCSER